MIQLLFRPLHFAIELQGDARLLRLLEDSTRIAAYRLVQEAVTNVIRHARATQCGVRLRINRRGPHLWLFLAVRDNGLGRADFLRAGNGIRGMRARLLGGEEGHLRRGRRGRPPKNAPTCGEAPAVETGR